MRTQLLLVALIGTTLSVSPPVRPAVGAPLGAAGGTASSAIVMVKLEKMKLNRFECYGCDLCSQAVGHALTLGGGPFTWNPGNGEWGPHHFLPANCVDDPPGYDYQTQCEIWHTAGSCRSEFNELVALREELTQGVPVGHLAEQIRSGYGGAFFAPERSAIMTKDCQGNLASLIPLSSDQASRLENELMVRQQ